MTVASEGSCLSAVSTNHKTGCAQALPARPRRQGLPKDHGVYETNSTQEPQLGSDADLAFIIGILICRIHLRRCCGRLVRGRNRPTLTRSC